MQIRRYFKFRQNIHLDLVCYAITFNYIIEHQCLITYFRFVYYLQKLKARPFEVFKNYLKNTKITCQMNNFCFTNNLERQMIMFKKIMSFLYSKNCRMKMFRCFYLAFKSVRIKRGHQLTFYLHRLRILNAYLFQEMRFLSLDSELQYHESFN